MLREVFRADELDYTKIQATECTEPILPVVCIDAQRLASKGLSAYRMQGFANQAAVEKTIRTKFVTFWSRSKQGLWTKGETSGGLLIVRGLYTDCDADSLLIDVDPRGPTCHTGSNSCFEIPN